MVSLVETVLNKFSAMLLEDMLMELLWRVGTKYVARAFHVHERLVICHLACRNTNISI